MASSSILRRRGRVALRSVCQIVLATLLALLLAASAVPSASAGSNSWTRLGLKGTRILAVAVAPTNPSLVLSTDGKAIYRSQDRGASWTTATADAAQGPAISVGALQFDPQDADVVYAGRGFVVDPRNPSTLYVGNPMQYVWQGYRSADGGTTWKPITAGNIGSTSPVLVSTDWGDHWKQGGPKADPDLTYSVALNPTNPQELIAAGEGKLLMQEIQRSTDGGKSWRKASLPGGSGARTDSSLVYNADGGALFAFGRYFQAPLYRSIDKGQTWRSVLAKSGVCFEVFPSSTSATEIFAVGSWQPDPPEDSLLRDLEGLYRSADNGATFARVAAPAVDEVSSLAFDSGVPQTLYAATSDGVWAYTVGSSGATPRAFSTAAPSPTPSDNGWARLGLAGKKITAVAAAPDNPSVILASDEMGVVYRSDDRGKTWNTKFTLPCREGPCPFLRIEFDPKNAQTVYGNTTGRPWTSVIDPQDPGTLYAGTWGALWRSTDGGKTWKYIGGNSGAGILRSTDGGKTWQETGLKVDTEKAKVESDTTPFVFGVAVKPTDSRVLVADGHGKADLLVILRSADGGKTWRERTLPTSSQPISESLVYNADGTALFTAFTVYRSLDDGQTWQSVLAKQNTYYGVFPNPTNPSDVFAVGSKEVGMLLPRLEGIHRSMDKGATFAGFAAPQGVKSVASLAFDRATPQTLYAATNDGVWAYTLGQAVAAVTPTPMPTNTAVVSPTTTVAPTPTSAATASPTSSASPTEAVLAVATAAIATPTPSPTRTPTEGSALGSTVAAVGAGAVVLAVGASAGRRIWRRPL